jgi:anti-sigma factor RsiW
VTNTEARRILIAHRPGQGNAANDAEVSAALEEVRRNPELAQWWKKQQAFHAAMAQGFVNAPVPDGLHAAIWARVRVVPFPWWRQPRIWAAAAAIAFLLGSGVFLLWPEDTAGSLATFRSRMVRTVLRQYRMDIQTNDLAAVRQFHATNGAPADYVLPPGLALLPVSGAGVLSWQGSHVSMVCLDAGAQGPLFLFVADAAEVHPPSDPQEFAPVNKLMTVSWSKTGKVYVLASPGGRETLEKYLPGAEGLER